jgi:hypothetical protein
MLNLQHQYNNHTTILHMRVGPSSPHTGAHPYVRGCCDGVVYESNPNFNMYLSWFWIKINNYANKKMSTLSSNNFKYTKQQKGRLFNIKLLLNLKY